MRQRVPVRALSQLPDQTVVRVCGRVVALDEDAFVLQDDTGCVTVRSSPAIVATATATTTVATVTKQMAAAPTLGAFVEVVAKQSGAGLTDVESAAALSQGGERFAQADSDWSWLTGARMQHLRTRQQLKRAVERFFDAAGLLEIETPAVVPCPGLDIHLDAIEVLGMRGARWLHTSPEYQMKRVLTTGVPGIFQLSKAFRRGERGRLHEPEFTMLEWYRTFADATAVMRDTENLVAHVALELNGTHTLPGIEGPVDVMPPWERLTVAEAFERHADISLAEALRDEDVYFEVLADQIEPKLGRGRATFLTAYPAAMASLAKLSDSDPRVAERFEAYLDGVEVCNGFSELVDAVEQRARLKRDQATREKLGRSVYPLDERFLGALEAGIPPSGGNALGFDRLLMLLVGAKRIDEVIALPFSRT